KGLGRSKRRLELGPQPDVGSRGYPAIAAARLVECEPTLSNRRSRSNGAGAPPSERVVPGFTDRTAAGAARRRSVNVPICLFSVMPSETKRRLQRALPQRL